MANLRRFELDELTLRPGTYFNPQTEIVLIVDDSPDLDAEAFGLEEHHERDWVLVSDEIPVDEHRRDELLERLQVRLAGEAVHHGDDEVVEEEDELEPDEELE